VETGIKSSILASALKLAERGFYIFPLQPNSKKPALVGDWHLHATRDIDQLKAWWGDNPNYNIGLALHKYNGAGERLIGVDVDVRDGKQGLQTLETLELIEGLMFPKTFEQTTATGGRHLLFKTKKNVRQKIEKTKAGIDFITGYLVGAGSIIDGKPYGFVEGEVAEVPEWVMLRWNLEHRAPTASPVIDITPTNINQQQALSRAVEYLKKHAPLAIKGNGGDSTTFQVAASVKDFGVDSKTCWQLMLDHWNERTSPGWAPDRLWEKVQHAYKYGKDPIGSIAPEAEFTPVIEEPKALVKPKQPKLYVEKFKDIVAKTERLPLIQDTLDFGAMTVIYGESNSGKSFFTLDLAFSVATGRAWFGKRVQQGAVLYVSAEAGTSFRKRVVAIRKDTKTEGADLPFGLVPCPVDLLDPKADTQPLISLIKDFGQTCGIPVHMTVIDTLARAIAGGNENAPDDMGAFVGNLDHIRDATGCHLVVVHHSGKDKLKGARGHSSLRAATDTEIEIANLCASVTKQRDFESGQQIGFSLEPIEIGKNSMGEPVESCVIRRRAFEDAPGMAQAVSPVSVAGKFLEVARQVISADGTLQPGDLDDPIPRKMVHIDILREEFFQRYYVDADRRVRSYTFSRALDKLIKCHHLVQRGENIGMMTSSSVSSKMSSSDDGAQAIENDSEK
jgi:hypothetical protein